MPAAPLDAEAFTAAFARHGRALWVLASAWVGRSHADDIVQETARVAWQRRAQFVTGTDPGPWLARIARQLGANHRRKRRPEPHDPAVLATVPAAAGAPADWPFDADRAGLSDELAGALAGLPAPARACLLLHSVGGMTFTEVGALLELPANTAASHARRARLAIRAALSRSDAAPVSHTPEQPCRSPTTN